MTDGNYQENQPLTARCSETTDLAAVHPGVQWFYNSRLFWKGWNISASIFNLLMVFVLSYFGAVTHDNILYLIALFFLCCLLHTRRMYKNYDRHARILAHHSWVLNHIPPTPSTITVHRNRWFKNAMIISVRNENHDPHARYELLGAAKDLEEVLQTKPTVHLHYDPVTKEPAAIAVDGKSALVQKII